MRKANSINIHDKIFTPYISREEISRTVSSIAAKINSDYFGREPLFLIVLKGAVFFAADLLREIALDCEMRMIEAKSYGMGMVSNGDVKITGLEENLGGKDIIVIEDIVDTGHTLEALTKKLLLQNPKSLECACFLSKTSQREAAINVKYIGLETEPAFVIGYGLDYAEKGRHLPEIYIHRQEA